jgi:glutamine synthetase|tara:strand:- start:3580 stop:4605 length:1026 start_codon:yes stop_codon:yes gene_type:complete
MKIKLEYVWLDGYTPEPNLRSKTKIVNVNDNSEDIALQHCPEWSFDGSSTKQAEGNDSDCILKPRRLVRDPQRPKGYIVLCETLNPNGSPHESNYRSKIKNDLEENWFGFEQEYVIFKDGKPIGWPKEGYPDPQGRYYCGVGGNIVDGRKIAEEHLDVCMLAGLDITGVNAEVMLGQWEYQIFGMGAKKASDDLWISRFLLNRIAEIHDVQINIHPKPIEGDWNGSGMHVNFSNREMREVGGEKLFNDICDTFSFYHDEHIEVYGSENDKRLTGLHETQAIDKFSYGVSDRGASIRIPVNVTKNNWRGYLEDRRPSSNADPYKVTGKILETLTYTNQKQPV